MQEYFELLRHNPLFSGIQAQELPSLLACLNAKIVPVEKDKPIFLEGDSVSHVGIVLSGAVQVVRDDYYGTRNILTIAEAGDLFGEVFACAGIEFIPVSVFALQNSNIMLFDFKKVLTVCSNICQFHTLLIQNLMQVLARKNLILNQKIGFLSLRTTKEKVMAYLLDQAKLNQSNSFLIPLDRQGLADYLGVERSAMSTEIGKLKKAGIIDCKGSWFHLNISAD